MHAKVAIFTVNPNSLVDNSLKKAFIAGIIMPDYGLFVPKALEPS